MEETARVERTARALAIRPPTEAEERELAYLRERAAALGYRVLPAWSLDGLQRDREALERLVGERA
jgi:hypothetical protein